MQPVAPGLFNHRAQSKSPLSLRLRRTHYGSASACYGQIVSRIWRAIRNLRKETVEIPEIRAGGALAQVVNGLHAKKTCWWSA